MPSTRPFASVDGSDSPPIADEIPSGPFTPEDVKFSPKLEKLRVNIEGVYMGIGGLVMIADAEYGAYISTNANGLSIAWIELAQVNPTVLKQLERFTSGGAAGQLIAMHIALLMPLAVKYNLLPGLAAFQQTEETVEPEFNMNMN